MAETRVLVATTSFAVGSTIVRKGDTVEAGHPITVGREGWFKPFEAKFRNPVERAPAKAEPEPEKKQAAVPKAEPKPKAEPAAEA